MVYLRVVRGFWLAGLAVVAVAAALAGCGYKLVSYQGALGDVRRITIERLDNDSVAPGYGTMMTDALLREFQRRGAVQVVTDPEQADLVIGGRVLPLIAGARSFSAAILALEYQVTVTVDLVVRRRDGSRVPVDPAALTESEFYLASSDPEVAQTNRNEALRRVANVIAGRVHDSLYERLMP